MRNKSSDLDKIQAYLKNELETNERINFEEQLKEDENLAMEVLFSRDIQFTLQHQDLIKANQHLSSLRSSNYKTTLDEKPSINLFNKWWVKLLIMLVVSGLGYWWVNQSELFTDNTSNTFESQQYQDLLYAFDYPITFSAPNSDLTVRGQKAFSEKEYEQATSFFEQALQENKDADVQLLLAISILRGKAMTTEAITHLELLEIETDNIKEYEDMQSYIHWFLGLAYLKEKQYDNANSQFEHLTTKPYFKDKLLDIEALIPIQ